MKKLREMSLFIVGLGQIGGSIGLDLVRRRAVSRVIGFDSHRASLSTALERRAVDQTVTSIASGLANADLVILATPLDVTIRLLPNVLRSMPEKTLCLDVASVKSGIFRVVDRMNPRAGYVSLHPIAGTEGSGMGSATEGLFTGKVITVTPAASTHRAQVRIAKELIGALDGEALLIGAKRHDQLLSQTSHLPYAIAAALVQVAAETGKTDKLLWRLTGGSFASATRVANSSPELTRNLLMGNRTEVSKSIRRMESELTKIRKMLESEQHEAFGKYVEAARKRCLRRKR